MSHRPPPSDEKHRGRDDLFRARLDQIIWHNHAIVRHPDAVPWECIVEQVADLLLPTSEGARRVFFALWVTAGLLYLWYVYDLMDDQVLER